MFEKFEISREAMVIELQGLLRAIDEDNSGSISYDELHSVLDHPTIRNCFVSIGYDLREIDRLYELIDEEGTGEIQIDDLLTGCMRLKGEARRIDVHALLRETKRIEARLVDQHNRHELFCVQMRDAVNSWEDLLRTCFPLTPRSG